jgi:hypothetical protein
MGQTHATPLKLSAVSMQSLPPEDFQSPAIEESSSIEVPVMFKWTHGGQRVYITGTFNNWASQGIPMVRSGQEFYQVVQVAKGVHEYKFMVDGEWKYSSDQPVLQDLSGNVNNVVDLQYYEKFEPAALRDPLDVEEDDEDWTQENIEPAQAEPPSAPPLLVRLPLLGVPSARKADASRILASHTHSQSSQVNIPLFAVSGHLQHDASASFRNLAGEALVCTSCVRFAQKYSTTVLLTLNHSARSDGLLRHYGVIPSAGLVTIEESNQDTLPPACASNIFQQALFGIETGDARELERSQSRSRPFDLSSYTD